MTRDKGLPELVEAFASILAARPDVHLLLVGFHFTAQLVGIGMVHGKKFSQAVALGSGTLLFL